VLDGALDYSPRRKSLNLGYRQDQQEHDQKRGKEVTGVHPIGETKKLSDRLALYAWDSQ
jgi:hypothetical protein